MKTYFFVDAAADCMYYDMRAIVSPRFERAFKLHIASRSQEINFLPLPFEAASLRTDFIISACRSVRFTIAFGLVRLASPLRPPLCRNRRQFRGKLCAHNTFQPFIDWYQSPDVAAPADDREQENAESFQCAPSALALLASRCTPRAN